MKHPWERVFDLANIMGLVLGAIGLWVVGVEINNSGLLSISLIAIMLFSVLLILTSILLVRDIFDLYDREYRK